MIKFKSIANAFLVLSLMSVSAIAQNQSKPQTNQTKSEAEELLKKVSETNLGLKSFHFDGETVMEMKADGVFLRMEMPFVIAYGKPGYKRAMVKGPFEMNKTIVSDGQFEWVYLPSEKQYTKKPLEKNAQAGQADASPLSQFKQVTMFADMISDDLTEGLNTARILREEEIEVGGKRINCIVVQAVYGEKVAEAPDGQASEKGLSIPMTFWIDKSRLIVLRHSFNEGGFFAEIFKALGDNPVFSMTTSLKLAQINEELPSSLFAYAPPADANEVEKFDARVAAELTGEEPERESLVGQDAVSFMLNDLNGKQFSMDKLRGKVVVIDFWASWCGPCRETMPHIEKLHREFKDKGLVVLGMNDEGTAEAKQFVQKNGYTFPTLVDVDSAVSQQYGVMAIPQTLVIDRDGKIIAHYFGTGQEENLRETIIETLAATTANGPKPVKKQVAKR